MSQLIKYSITLNSEAELGTGLGTKLVDSLLPRNIDGDIIVPASHIKGIIRENIEYHLAQYISLDPINTLFGMEGVSDGAMVHFGDAVAEKNTTKTITRTKLNEFGVAESGSLRTSEAVATGTTFVGIIYIHSSAAAKYEKLIKFGLLTLRAIGGNRTRGAGNCLVTIDSDDCMPGELFEEITKIEDWSVSSDNSEVYDIDNDKVITLKLLFKAENPVCTPETPVTENNIIKSGFSIPASAVQGMVLHRLNNISSSLASSCFESPVFRAWPLNPSSEDGLGIRVSLTHKVSKTADENGDFLFRDEMIESYDMEKVPAHAPLKSSDGVLLYNKKQIKLWKSSDMPRYLSTHGVINGDRGKNPQKRNLFTVEAMAPMTFTGIISLPEKAAKVFTQSLKENNYVQLGKSRSIRGGGTLTVEKIDLNSHELFKENDVFIVQSPILIDEKDAHKPVSEVFSKLVEESGFGEVDKCSGAITTLFGWNKLKNNGMLSCVAAIEPGSVFKLKEKESRYKDQLIKGIGGAKDRGFGAVYPHPGFAKTLYPDMPEFKKLDNSKNYSLDAYELYKKAKGNNLSASQLSTVREIALNDREKAKNYLDKQIKERPAGISDRWIGLIKEIKSGLDHDYGHYMNVLKVCRDLLSSN